jgi:hypothetical protein
MMRITIAFLVVVLTGMSVLGQTPTLKVVTSDPNLPSELFYGNVKVKPLRVRPGTNPPQLITIDDSDFYVQQQYVDFLNRMPDAPGFTFWNNQITACGGNSACTEVQRVNTSGSFFLSIEFKETGYLVERTYRTSYGEPDGLSTLGGTPHQIKVPVIRLSDFVPDLKTIGQGVIVLQPGWEQALETNKVNYFAAFVQRTRFTTAFPGSLTPAQFVSALNTNAGNPLSPSELTTLSNEHTAGTKTRAQVLRQIAEHPNLVAAEFNKAFVLMQFYGYLRRDPDSGPDPDFLGYEFWLNKLNQFNGNFITAEMVKAFIASAEYKNRF